MEVIAEHIDGNHPLALANLRARLARLQRTIEAAAAK
jgi:ABC-type spermidine/putrescine transport system permease subunit II